jgi:hypothetical protein
MPLIRVLVGTHGFDEVLIGLVKVRRLGREFRYGDLKDDRKSRQLVDPDGPSPGLQFRHRRLMQLQATT